MKTFEFLRCGAGDGLIAEPLAEALGAAQGAAVASCCVDVVKSAGHSCPTMAGAWPMTRAALIDRVV